MRIALYFGSFNPIHIGHMIIANIILHESEVDEVWFVVSPHNPLKELNTLLDEHLRVELVQRAIADEKGFKLCTVELDLPRPSYTIQTMDYLKNRYPNYQFKIVLGGDSLQSIDKWKSYERLLAENEFIIYNRPGFEVDKNLKARITILNAPLLSISSTRIRERIKLGKTIRYLVPESVYQDIMEKKFYL